MAACRLIKPLRRLAASSISSCSKVLASSRLQPSPISSQNRTYISEMRKSAFEGRILRMLRDEIEYELDGFTPAEKTPEFNSFLIDELPGEQWMLLSKKFGESEVIKVEVTMFDGSVRIRNFKDVVEDEEVKLHMTLVIEILKKEEGETLEFVCLAWPDSIEIQKVFVRGHEQKGHPFTGPKFKELDDELQDSLYDFLEERGVNEDLAAFLHRYMKSKDKNELVRWMGSVKSFIEKK
ncbi:uncharacterized protein At2g39795, mitochondrial-like [Impatiens glandulifera]|uniref:uncharacterized protein At2g39795, mitochondrial-like n=1 Tax=Impatiens glandulifera TaxID=253017 RepID=UPI001FB08D64|nr:uncharacterized protein At2g39795, mitochondrial-like [Impatiens glandulifera]